MKTHKSTRARSVAMLVCLTGVAVLILGVALAGCSFSGTPEATSERPLSRLRADILNAGISTLEGSQLDNHGLYLKVVAPEGQEASAVADRVVSLAQKYKEELDARWVRVEVVSTPGRGYDHTFDLDPGPSSTG